ncbi:MAG: PH domain-containing protein [Acidimicrobiales bacterium]|jgi:membrane protein YdbS with pleckstrin-like domain
MAFPRKLLGPGEEIVLESQPNWSILVPRTLVFLAVVAASVAILVEWTSAPLWVGYVLLGIGAVALLWLLAKVITWRSTSLVLTTTRVVYRTGVMRRLGREIPLDRIQDVTYIQSIFERLLGAGSLRIESAGASGDEPFPDIRQPAVVQSLINRLLTQSPGPYGGGLGGGGHAGHQTPQPQYQQPPPQQYAPPQSQYQAPQSQYAPPQQQPPAYPPPQAPPQYAPQQYAPPQPKYGAPQPPDAAGRQGLDLQSESQSEQLARLADLHRLGVITDAEFEQKRREIAGQ